MIVEAREMCSIILLFLGGVKRARVEFSANKNVSDAEQDAAAKMLSDLGL